MYGEHIQNVKSQSKNVHDQYVYHCCLFLIFDLTETALFEKYYLYLSTAIPLLSP